MGKSLFPLVGTEARQGQVLPLAKDCAIDFVTGRPMFRDGRPRLVTGQSAVQVWAYNAVRTSRFGYEMHTPNYGSDLVRLMGQGLSDATTKVEVVRAITECLMVSPYITAVEVANLELVGDEVHADVSITSIYGRSGIHV